MNICPICGEGLAEITCAICYDIVCPNCIYEGVYDDVCGDCIEEDKEVNSEE